MNEEMTATLHGVNKHEISVELHGGKSIHFETGKLAKQAHGSCIVRIGDNVVLATACANPDPREGIDFFPLTVDYREYTYAAGRIPGGFIKREGRPSEREILTSRQIDRPIRPLFPEGFRCETQVIAMVLSADTENDPDVAGINGASVALSVSDIPFHGPIGAVRVGQVDGNFIINPTYAERRDGNLNLMVVGTAEGIVMIESGAREVSEETVVQGIEFGHQEIKKICAAISDLAQKVGKPKRAVEPVIIDEAYLNELRSKLGDRLLDAVNTEKHPKNESYALIKQLKDELKAAIPEEDEAGRKKAAKYFDLLREQLFREQVIKEHRRPDGRKFDQIRDIWIEVGVLPRTHGSAIFTRGETQALVTTTLGTGEDMQRLEAFEGEAKKRFMLHYNFPPFSVGEVAFLRGAGRREIGHGALAERAISAVSAGGNRLAVRDAHRVRHPGVERIVLDGDSLRSVAQHDGRRCSAEGFGCRSGDGAGEGRRAYADPHRHRGRGRPLRRHGLQGRRHARWHYRAADGHQGDGHHVADHARGAGAGPPRATVHPRQDGRGDRRAAHQDQRICSSLLHVADSDRQDPRPHRAGRQGDSRASSRPTGVKIDVEDSGKVNVSSSDQVAAAKALQMIGDITATAEVGKTYLGKVTRLADFGAFVEIIPGTDGLLHISEVAEHRINDVRDELKEGDQVLVKVLAVEGNRIKLSRKAILKEQRAKMGGGEAPPAEGGEARSRSKADTRRRTNRVRSRTSIAMASGANMQAAGAKAVTAEAGADPAADEAEIADRAVDRAARQFIRRIEVGKQGEPMLSLSFWSSVAAVTHLVRD